MGPDKSGDTIDQISLAWHRWFKLVLMIFYPEWRSVGHGGCYWWPDQLRQANDTDIVCEGVSMIHNNCWCDVEWNFWSALRRSFCLGRHCQLMLHSLYISYLSDVHNHLFLAVQDSSIGDLVTQWVSEWVSESVSECVIGLDLERLAPLKTTLDVYL